ncbi:3-hydroxybutyrate dehydrogenase [Herbidospora galbida]|uniref:3-hydroxybutyrate dehydrogenase n=1 Tax=Herbidospora galbida TaxID=2575442 RepID=A0A4U3LWU7_9ACTN|nr:3-hydroxybutyrate dehydrogenase [Herbidospora galbida]TKK80695.1 3-hydroxybutyrate dehydrogenase [Herbidospora galbida]
MTKDLAGRTALVTGAGSGIGRACAIRLAAAGAHVVVADLREHEAAETAAMIGGVAVTADLADPAAYEEGPLIEHAAQADMIVNNAGFQHVAPIEEFPPEIFSRLMSVQVEAPFRLIRAALPYMKENRFGRVVNISSVHGLRASPFKVAYVTAKHALEGLSKVIALEGAPYGVTSTCVCPAYVRTPLVENQIAAQAEAHRISPEEVVERIMLQPAAIKRLVEPEEVAEMVAYLCGPAGSFITGVSIPLDGGWSAR